MSSQFKGTDLMKCLYRKLLGHHVHPVVTQDTQNEHLEQHVSVEVDKNTPFKQQTQLTFIYLSIYTYRTHGTICLAAILVYFAGHSNLAALMLLSLCLGVWD